MFLFKIIFKFKVSLILYDHLQGILINFLKIYHSKIFYHVT